MCELEEIREQKSLFGVDINDVDTDLEVIRTPRSLFDNGSEQGETEMQTLGLCDEPESEKPQGFWRRQFQTEPTRRQRQYDWFFGVVIPLVCIFFDPFVFRGGGLLGIYRPFAYSISFISIMAMVAWLLWREKVGGFGALLAGLFFAASAVSLAVGIVLAPFSLVGLVIVIGALGFTPFFTSVIFLRNGVRALRAANVGLGRSTLVYAPILSGLFGLTVPYVLYAEVNRSLDLIVEGSPTTIRSQGLKLRLLAPLVDPGQLQRIYRNEQRDSAERSEIQVLYRQLTGKELVEYGGNWMD